MEITPFTTRATVKVFNPNNENEFRYVQINVPAPNFDGDTIDQSRVEGEDVEAIFSNGVVAAVSVYNTISGGDVFATSNGRSARIEIVYTKED